MTGTANQVRSYNIGYYTKEQMNADAKENRMTVSQYIRYWFSELNDGTMRFTWQALGTGYGCHGTTVAEFKNPLTDGIVTVREIYGQIMIDERPRVSLKGKIIKALHKVADKGIDFSTFENEIEMNAERNIRLNDGSVAWLVFTADLRYPDFWVMENTCNSDGPEGQIIVYHGMSLTAAINAFANYQPRKYAYKVGDDMYYRRLAGSERVVVVRDDKIQHYEILTARNF